MRTLAVCHGFGCRPAGARDVLERLRALVCGAGLASEIDVREANCMGRCGDGVHVRWDGAVYRVSPGEVDAFFRQRVLPDHTV